MVEPILYASFGALLATLIGLLFLPIFWRRAVKITTRRLIDRLPVSASEIVAGQDRLRAEQAMAMRVVERKAESAIGDATRDRVDAARARATELGHLADISDLKAKVASLESEGARVRGELDKTGKEAAAAYDALKEARAAADASARELQTVRQEASASRAATEQARIEASARESEVASLRAKLEDAPEPRSIEPSLESPPHSPAAHPAADEQPRRMPKADFALAFPPQPGAAPSPPATLTEAAELADLRRRLDEVADAIVSAAKAPARETEAEPEEASPDAAEAPPAPRESPPTRPRATEAGKRPRLPQIERLDA